jgi:hypothetical protein
VERNLDRRPATWRERQRGFGHGVCEVAGGRRTTRFAMRRASQRPREEELVGAKIKARRAINWAPNQAAGTIIARREGGTFNSCREGEASGVVDRWWAKAVARRLGRWPAT